MMYLDFSKVVKNSLTFNYIIGPRGNGKTYGALAWANQTGSKYILMRRTQTEMDILTSKMIDQFEELNRDFGWHYSIDKAGKNMAVIWDTSKEDASDNIGLGLCLSTIRTIRGFNGLSYEYLIYDEFIPETTAKAMKGEASAFLQAYETINRNRELQGREPMKVFLLSNSNDLAHPLLCDLGIDRYIEKMARKNEEMISIPERDCTIWLPKSSEYVERKAETALYKFSQGTKFYKMALNNEFSSNDQSGVRSYDCFKMKPIVSIDKNFCIYKDKKSPIYYCAFFRHGRPKTYSDNDGGWSSFIADYRQELTAVYLRGNMRFETYNLKSKILALLGYKC